MISSRALIALSLLAVLGCEKKLVGRKLASGIATGLTVQKNAAAFLLNAEHPGDPGVPQDLLLGDLYAGPLDHEAKRIGSGVPSQPGSFAFSNEGYAIAYLARYRFRDGAGALWASRMGPGVPEQVGREVRAFAWSPVHAALAFVAPDTLSIRGAYELHLPGVQSIVWSPDGMFIAARASAVSGGALWLVDARHGTVRKVAEGTSDFAFSPDGVLASLGQPGPKGGDRPLFLNEQKIAEATAFQFSPDGKQIALFSTSKQPGEATGDLYKMPVSSVGTPVLIASEVSDWRWSSTGELLSLARYDLRARAGGEGASLHGLRQAHPVSGPGAAKGRLQAGAVERRSRYWLPAAEGRRRRVWLGPDRRQSFVQGALRRRTAGLLAAARALRRQRSFRNCRGRRSRLRRLQRRNARAGGAAASRLQQGGGPGGGAGDERPDPAAQGSDRRSRSQRAILRRCRQARGLRDPRE